MKKIIFFTFVSLTLLIAITSYADNSITKIPVINNNRYQIEVAVFAYTNPQPGSEIWPNIVTAPNLENSINLTTTNATSTSDIDPAPQPIFYKILPKNSCKLTKELHKMQRSGNYRIILHKAWIQPILDKGFSKAQPIHIFGGQNYNTDDSPIWQIDGTLNITLNTYFNIKTDLLLTAQHSELPNNLANIPESPFSASLSSFSLQSYDRMRSNQPYYFDHPLFGMLVLITRDARSTTPEL